MKTLVILAQKGGSGKTTLAVHMAVCAARQKRRTALIDIDPQSSAFNWNESRDEGRKLDAAKAEAGQIPALLQQAKAGGIDLAIIDTAPHSDSAAAIAAQYADLVLIPCRPARFDLDAIASTVQIATVAKKSATVVINAAPRGKLAEEARAALERQGITVIDTVLHQRAAYSHAVIDGRSVHEYEPDGKAAAEIDELYNHLTRLLGYKQARGKAA
ncbi:MAG TPA: ParA family partition ATPase [Gammaproteobacteria bacterium]|jgi:chromosome partitioning protein|nr:ParA family partition ATPase [Gammaproteobacteria bacterium]